MKVTQGKIVSIFALPRKKLDRFNFHKSNINLGDLIKSIKVLNLKKWLNHYLFIINVQVDGHSSIPNMVSENPPHKTFKHPLDDATRTHNVGLW